MRIVSLFSGAGAFEEAFKQMNIPTNVCVACDIDKYAKESYLTNFEADLFSDDVTTLDVTNLRDIDFVVGGSPCQSFSMAGNRVGLKDTRGLLIFEYMRIVNECKPKYFIYENVPAITSDKKQWQYIYNEFEKLGYSMYIHVLNSKDYGIPQSRKRLFIVGFRDKEEFLKYSTPSTIELGLTAQDLLESNPESKYFYSNRSAIYEQLEKEVIDAANIYHYRKNRPCRSYAKVCYTLSAAMGSGGNNVPIIKDKYYLSEKTAEFVTTPRNSRGYINNNVDTDLPVARTLLASMGTCHHAGVDNYITDDKGIRKLTPRECFRLMGFSDDYKIVVSDTQAYKQAGNSIVVDVIKAMLKEIFKNKGDISNADNK